MTLFFAWPAVQTLLIAFQKANGSWTLDNFGAMARDTDFRLALRNTLLVLVLIIPIETTIALLMAVLAQSRLFGRDVMLYIWSIPLAVSDLAAGLVWFSIFTSHGYLNSVLQDLHLIAHPVGFLDYNNLGGLVTAIVLAEVWRSMSLVMVIIMSGIQAIPPELDEAAESLGAGAWQRFWKVTLPLLKPTLQVALILRTTTAFQVFGVVLALAGSALPVLAVKSESWVTEYRNYQLAATYAILILVLSSLSTVGYLLFLRTPREVFQR
ncbi:MAG: sugar ABC transporter permease [Candidatus Dormibacteraeota bacterium]|uniref:Sugar ABC transporter permease n=2 Tax=Candidatus Dormiibacter inghamiae TaxID=3127013 RepID=A0A934N735_9BACT|nr:sugar ABC transporter permease [Candidatus Dormibacteraeota bacterium]MBJ7607653.1 sugar ABC transporter permease [Candidatus Dormibacteraeota bacterium]